MPKTLKELSEQFLEYLEIEKNCSPLTIRDYRHYLNRFLAWLTSDVKDSAPKAITLDKIRKYRVWLAHYEDSVGRTLSKQTQSYHVIALRAFLKWLVKNDYETLSPDRIDLPKGESKSLKFLDHSQLERLLAQPAISQVSGLRDKVILEMLFSTGLRVSELVKLDRDKINLERREFGVIGKGGRARIVFLSTRAVFWIKKYFESRTDYFKPLLIRFGGNLDPTMNDEKMRLTVRSVQRIVEKYVRLAKLPIKITPHGIRHTFATDLLIAGADLRSVQEMLGHKNISTTQIYTHVTNLRLREIHDAFHGKGR